MKFARVYLEESVADHPRALRVLARCGGATAVTVPSHRELFLRRAQDFRMQKRAPALILARQREPFLNELPEICGARPARAFYFSHLRNCPYDCRYCYLQGALPSAHFLFFVDYEECLAQIEAQVRRTPGRTYFHSGHECDSLALESLTGFAKFFVPAFRTLAGATLELRTKSGRTDVLQRLTPHDGVVVAFSLAPDAVARALERGAPPVARRLAALRELAARGWQVAPRFDPLIHYPGFREGYRELIDALLDDLPIDRVHSVAASPLRFTRGHYRAIIAQHPGEPFLAAPYEDRAGVISYRSDLQAELVEFVRGRLARMLPPEKLLSEEADAADAAVPAGTDGREMP